MEMRLWAELRLPRMLLALAVGGSLASLGGAYQYLFRNPLAEPYLLGISSAVSLGIVVANIFFGFDTTSWPAMGGGFLFAVAAASVLLVLCLQRTGGDLERVVLFGLAMSFVFSSFLFLLLSYQNQSVGGGSLRWLFGQLPWVSWTHAVGMFGLALFLVGFLVLYGRSLDALSLGDGVARSLGFFPERTRAWIVFSTSLLVAVLVANTGTIGFVGLVVPHGVRLLFRPSSARLLVGLSFLFGALFLEFTDVVSRTLLPPFEFPIGIITTLVGGPVFLVLLWGRR